MRDGKKVAYICVFQLKFYYVPQLQATKPKMVFWEVFASNGDGQDAALQNTEEFDESVHSE